MTNTLEQYNQVVERCRDIFIKKTRDYGTAWRILRPSSLTDQIFIKAQRIRTLQEKGLNRVGEGIEPEFIGIINYSMMALIQLELGHDSELELSPEKAENLFLRAVDKVRSLMEDKNHDYGEAWRDMRVSSLTDLILMKVLRVKQIEDNKGQTLISEGVDANYMDMANYAIFALILLGQDNP